jgi:protein-export membrane protein SecD
MRVYNPSFSNYNLIMNLKQKIKLKFVLIIALAVLAGLVSYPQAFSKIPPVYNFFNKLKINLGLDLQGGIHLEYSADVSQVDKSKIQDALQGAQDVINRRINAFGVGEPLVQTATSSGDYRIIVELPGIKDVEAAKQQIKETPLLEFKEETGDDPEMQKMFDSANSQAQKKAQDLLNQAKSGANFEDLAKQNSEDPGSKDKGGDLDFVKKGTFVPEFDKVLFDSNLGPGEIYPDLVETQYGWHIIKFIESRGDGSDKEVRAEHILIAKKSASMYPDLQYKSTGLTGKNLKSASVVFQNQGLSQPEVSLKFDSDGAKLFADLTKKNLNKSIAIYLDGSIISAPTVQSEITNGEAVITGNFTVDEANKLAQRLNEGALPLPLTLVSQETVEPTLGIESLHKSLYAGIIGLIAVIIFMIFYYRFLGLVASLSLLIYTGLMVSIFKLSAFSPWPITLSLSGIAGFVLSIGMAVDANILIFERTKEEVRKGRHIANALEEGFKRAWTSIRDGNVSSIITSGILILFGTGFVKGFAVTLIIGVLVSMFTAITITRNLLRFFIREWIYEKPWLVGVKKKSIMSAEGEIKK